MTAKPEHEAAYQDLVSLLRRNAPQVTSLEMLAIAANLVGKLVAMQDQTTVTVDDAMKVVAKNLERGNAEVLDRLKNAKPAGRG